LSCGRRRDSRAAQGTDRVEKRGATLDRSGRARAAGERQAGSSHGGVATTNNTGEFAPRFLEVHAKANRLKASGIASKECALRIHLVPALGDKPLVAITTEDVQHLKSALSTKSPKTVNNVLTVLNVLMRTAVEWDVIDRVPCLIKMLRTPRTEASFYEFDQFERLVQASAREPQAHLFVLLGGMTIGGVVAPVS
jgi:hypothetical protein